MDTATLIRTALSPDKYRSLVHSAAVKELEESGMHFLHELSESFLPKKRRSDKAEVEVWREAEGIETVMDTKTGAELYICLRRKWNYYIVQLAQYMGYDWNSIAPSDRA